MRPTYWGAAIAGGIFALFGIATYSSLWVTSLLGLLKFKSRVQRIDMGWHYIFAVLPVVLATLNLSLMEIVQHL